MKERENSSHDENQNKLTKSSIFVDINLSDQLIYYRRFIDLINSLVNDCKFVEVLPILNRKLLENILRDIFSSSLPGEYNYLYFNEGQGRIRNFSKLLDLFNKLRKNFEESYAVKIPDNIIGYLDRFRKDGNYSSHEIETLFKSNYVNEIRDDFIVTFRVLVQLYQKIINSDKKIDKIDEKILKGYSKILKSEETSKIIKLISSIRNEIVIINQFETKDKIIRQNIQEKIDELHISICKINLSTDSLVGIITNLNHLEFELNSNNINKQSLRNYLEIVSMYFKANLVILNKNDITIAKQIIQIKNQKIIIIFVSICFLFIFILVILKNFFQN